MPIHEQSNRQVRRIYLDLSDSDQAEQASGLPVTLKKTGLLQRLIGAAVVKDVSAGGAGIIAPVSYVLDDQFYVIFGKDLKVMAQVAHRRRISTRLVFIGVKWVDFDESQLPRVLKLIDKLTTAQLASESGDSSDDNNADGKAGDNGEE